MKGIIRKTACAAMAALAFGMCALSEASNLDTYRDLLIKRTYKIRYENITPPPRVTNRDQAPLFGKSGIDSEANNLLTNRPRIGLITAKGEDRYEEIEGVGPKGILYTCHLTKGSKDYFFSKWQEDNQWQYAGTIKDGKGQIQVKKNKVEAQKRNILGILVNGESFGENDLSRLLGAILPEDRRSAEQPSYEPIDSGWLDNGLNYEDYSAETGNGLNVIRYYFKQNILVKIAEASYQMNEDGTYSGRRCIIKIHEFSPTPDAAVLSLPEGLEEKKKDDGKGEDGE